MDDIKYVDEIFSKFMYDKQYTHTQAKGDLYEVLKEALKELDCKGEFKIMVGVEMSMLKLKEKLIGE
jgi:hypothetical protein